MFRLAAADAEADRADPILLALEGHADQIVGGFLAPDPGPAFIHDGRIGRAADCFHHRRMPMPETAAGIASVNQAPAVFEVEVNSLTTDDGERRAIAGIQPGPQKSTHRSLHPTVRRAKPRSSRADITGLGEKLRTVNVKSE